MKRTTLIVGGVAGGATVAARLSRLSADHRIVIIERGAHVSFANCGLPYYIGDVIKDQDSLLLATPELFRARYGIEVLLQHEALRIRREEKILEVRCLQTGEIKEMPYDELVLSPGAAPFRPDMPGAELPGVLTLRNIPDAEKIKTYIREKGARSALVIGAGFIGLEVAENLHELGLKVSIAEGASHVLPPLDAQMSTYVSELLEANGLSVETGILVSGIRRTSSGSLQAYAADGWQSAEVDVIMLSIGVRPETGLAREAGLELGLGGSIVVDEQMRSSDPSIWAVGDAVQVTSRVSGQPMLLALAGVAQKQARVAAAAIAGRQERFRGVWGSSVIRLFGLTVAMTGLNREALERLGYGGRYEYVDVHPFDHVTYYPDAQQLHLRLVYDREVGRILGATVIGRHGAARRADVIAMAMSCGGTVFDLAEAELCYSPQEGAAKDAVNMAGMAASNHINGLHPLAHAEDIAANPQALVLDVREPAEVSRMPYPATINIPLSQLRDRWQELPQDKLLLVMCQVGVRGYNATRFLMNKGYDVRHLSGGYITLRHV